VNLLITIDTEGDNAWAKRGHEQSTRNARFLPRFQEFCESFGYKPTYLATYEMAKDDFFVEFARDALRRNACEAGLHPHPWNSPPLQKLTFDDMRTQPYMIEYPQSVIRDKVRFLTDLLTERLETRLRSHRAGRWAFDATYAKVLRECGFQVDCSVTPFKKWDWAAQRSGEPLRVTPPDYSGFPAEPYFLDPDDISRPGDASMLEIPMTIIPNHGKLLASVYRAVPGPMQRVLRGAFGQPVSWFRPSRRRNRREMIRLAEHRFARNASYIMFMLHSSELMPGGSPSFPDAASIDKLYEDMEFVFRWVYDQGARGATCSQYYEAFTGMTRNASA
jgi:hypothetical protein